MNTIDYEILLKLQVEYANLNIKHLTFDDWLIERHGFYSTFETAKLVIIIVVDPKKKLLFDLKHP